MSIAKNLHEYFENNKIEIILYPDKMLKKINDFNQLFEFVNNEVMYWEPCTEGEIHNIRDYFIAILSSIESLRNSDEIKDIKTIDTIIEKLSINNFPCIYSTAGFGQFLYSRYILHPEQAEAALNYLMKKEINNLYSEEYLIGFIHTVNWFNLQSSDYLDNIQKSLEELKQFYIQSFDAQHSQSNKDIERYKTVFNDFLKESKSLITESDELIQLNKKELVVLEDTYKEKLKLEAPAKYWAELEDDYEKRGILWRRWAIFSSIVLMILLTCILYKLPDYFIDSSGFTFDVIKGTIILTIIVSLGVYLIRLFVKLTTSSYHLARDAKERYQLTYIYLALLKDSELNEGQRNIVFQSLFSRADTGLLKGDSSPTLPDGMLQQIMKLIKQ